MTILSLIVGLIRLAQSLAQYASDRQLISAGEARATAASLTATLENIDAATKAKNAMATGSDPDWAKRVRDKYSRD